MKYILMFRDEEGSMDGWVTPPREAGFIADKVKELEEEGYVRASSAYLSDGGRKQYVILAPGTFKLSPATVVPVE